MQSLIQSGFNIHGFFKLNFTLATFKNSKFDCNTLKFISRY